MFSTCLLYTSCSHPDRIDLDPLALGDVGRREGGDLPAVVLAVGQQDDYLALGVALPQAVDGRGKAVADGCACLLYTSTRALMSIPRKMTYSLF